ncbi:hypothetical protein [Fodinibius sp. Rm-B-1B1-1]|uniref:hypothetical protein n=1 Tax=Fodinibius alkaliphilus TaxID=3140241 RepID=UPI00315A4EB2
MPIKRILKIAGYIFVPLLPMTVAIYFLFPYLNEEKHKEVAEKHNDDFVIGDTTNVELSSLSAATEEDANGNVEDIGEDFSELKEKTSEFQQHIDSLQREVDSLSTVNDSLEQQLTLAGSGTGNTEVSEEEFSENIKSLLDLDIERLTPILSKMSDEQLVRIFKAGSGLQRKKLLRSLESDRAAKLMTEVL